MASICGDPAFEQQASLRVIEQRLTGGEGAEALRDQGLRVNNRLHAWNGRGFVPKIGLGPGIALIPRAVKVDLRVEQSGGMRRDDRKFAHTRFGARTLRMSEH